MSEPITKEQIAEYQKKAAEDFLKRLNAFLEGEDFTLVAVPFIDTEGRTKAEIKVIPKQ